MGSLYIEEQAEPRTGLSSAEVDLYQRDGFLIVRELFSGQEVGLLRRVLERDHEVLNRVRTGLDHEGNPVTIWISNRLGSDVLSAFVRSRHLVEMADRLLGDEAYHWHHKITFKESRNGGAWEWHQDYGYWYDYGCLFPDLVSVMIAIDRATPANGCLELIRGSHRLGRLDTSRRADQTSVGNEERLRAIQEEMEVVSCTLDPGDAVFFHANTLHRSGVNRSEYPRWALLCVYNARQNAPRDLPSERPHDPDAPPSSYVPLERWPRSRIAELAHERLGDLG